MDQRAMERHGRRKSELNVLRQARSDRLRPMSAARIKVKRAVSLRLIYDPKVRIGQFARRHRNLNKRYKLVPLRRTKQTVGLNR